MVGEPSGEWRAVVWKGKKKQQEEDPLCGGGKKKVPSYYDEYFSVSGKDKRAQGPSTKGKRWLI